MYAIKKNSTQIFLLGDHSPLGPWCSYHLASLASMLDSLFMGLCIVNLWIKGKICLLSFIKDLDSLTFGFLSFNATHYMCRCHLALFMWPYGGGWRRADNMATATAVSNKWSTLGVHHYLVPKCIHYPPFKTPCPLVVTSHSLLPAPGNHQSVFSIYWFASGKLLILVDS